MANKSVLIICAHNDDQIIGAGGTIAKYSEEGIKVFTVIISFGEMSHPHLKPEVITRTRVKESIESDKILGGAGVSYFGLKEAEFMERMKDPVKKEKIKSKLGDLIELHKPSKIFTHSADDPHIMHRKVHEAVMEITKRKMIDVYSFDVWNPIKVKGRNAPKMVVDITKTFDTKIRAFKSHKSQQVTIFTLLWNIYIKALLHGWANDCKYAEVFYKLN